MEVYFESFLYPQANLWKKIRKKAGIPIPEYVRMYSHAFEINVPFEEINFFKDSEVEYKFEYRDGILKERLRIHGREPLDLEWNKQVSKEEFEEFSRVIYEYFGVVHVGKFPNHIGMDKNKTADTLHSTLKTIGFSLKENKFILGGKNKVLYTQPYPNGFFNICIIGGFYEKLKTEDQLLSLLDERKKKNMIMLSPIIEAIEKNKLRNMFTGQRSGE